MSGVDHMPKSHSRRMCKPVLPGDIIFKILVGLPADIVYNVMRYVCRDWYNMIMDPLFIDAHLAKAPTGILFQTNPPTPYVFNQYLEVGNREVEVLELDFGTDFDWETQGPFKGNKAKKFPPRIMASCNGILLLELDSNLHVVNLALKQWVALPPINDKVVNSAGLAYAASRKEYKVTYTGYSNTNGTDNCAILTLGVDKSWRYLATSMDIPFVPVGANGLSLFRFRSFSVGGFIHWPCFSFVLSLDAETEAFHVSKHPEGHAGVGKKFLAMDGCISFVDMSKKRTWELVALTEVKSGGWTNMGKIDLTALMDLLGCKMPSLDVRHPHLCPVYSWRNGEFVVFEIFHRAHCEIYNVKTREEVLLLRTGNCMRRISCFGHVQSLVSLKSIFQ